MVVNATANENEWAKQLREAFRRSGLSMNKLNKLAGTSYASTHCFFMGTRDDVALATAWKWGKVLGLALRPMKRRAIEKG